MVLEAVMSMRRVVRTTIVVGIVMTEVIGAQQQPHDPGPLPPPVVQPIPLYSAGLGTFSRKISSSSADAQAYSTRASS
jgi:hypothetical protein